MITALGGTDPPRAAHRLPTMMSDNITRVVAEHARATPDAPAIITDDVTLDYAALDRATRRCAKDLQAWGLAPGDRVALVFRDELLLAISLLAIGRLGATAMAIPRSSTPAQYQDWVTRAGARNCVTDLARPAISALASWKLDRRWLTQARAITGDITPALGLEVKPCAPLMIVVGSGSTGPPKLIPITHAQMRHRVATINLIDEVTAQGRLALMTHLEYASGVHRLFCALTAGAAFVLPDRSTLAPADLRQRFGVTLLSTTVFHLEQMLRETPHNTARPLDGMVVTVSSSIVSDRLRRNVLDRLCTDLRIAYGANETWTATHARSPDLLHHNGTIGQVVPGVEVEIVDDQMSSVAAGAVGLIRIRSPSVVDGYLDNEHDTARAFRDGWFMTGDLGQITEDGHNIFLGRSDDMMIFNGINIYPIEIERCLLAHPNVIDAVAMPIHHRISQDIPVAFVALTHMGAADEQTLLAFASEKIGARRPHRVVLLERIPRNEHGKPIRTDLRRLAEEAISRPGQTSTFPPTTAPTQTISAVARPRVSLRQPERRLNVTFEIPEGLLTAAIDPWLGILNPELGAAAMELDSCRATSDICQPEGWLARVLLLARELLQLAALPVFDRPRLVSCGPQAPGGTSWRTIIAVPAIDHLPVRAYTMAIVAAMRASTWMSAHPATAANRDLLFEKLQQEVLEPLKQFASGGKSTMPVLQTAHACGIPFRSLGGGVYQLGWGAKGRVIDRSTNDRDSAIGRKLSHNKSLTAQALRLAGLPAPTHQVVQSLAEAQTAAARIGWPVVMKPTDLERGEGVSLDVDATRLELAFAQAQRFSRAGQAIVEQQVAGTCHRLFVASGRLLYAVKRLPIGVYGDGVRSVEAIVSAELTVQSGLPPWRRSSLRPIDDLARTAIQETGLRETSVPASGQFVPLRRIESTAWGGTDEDVTADIHPENVRVALAAAELLGLDVAGIDIVSPDIAVPWHRNGAIINEVNFAPLLGGGEISRRSIGEYLHRLLGGNGLIPVHAFLGGEAAWLAALDRRQASGDDRAGVFVTSAERTLDGNGQDRPMPFTSLYRRARALLLSRQVQALILVVQTDEFLDTGLPVECLDSLVEAGGALHQHRNPTRPVSTENDRLLRQLFSQALRGGSS